MALIYSNCSLIPSRKPALDENFIYEVTPEERSTVDSAIVALKDEISKDPENPTLYRKLAVKYRLKGTPRSRLLSIDAIKRAIKLTPGNPINFVQRGLTNYARGFIGEAENDFKRSVQLDPNCFEGWYHLGRLEYDEYIETMCFLDHLKKAIGYYKKANRIEKRDRDILFRLGFLHIFRQMYFTARRYARKAEIYHPDDYNVYLLLGTINLKLNKFNEAEHKFKEGFDLMTEEDKKPYFDISLLLPPDSRELWLTSSPAKKKEWNREFWISIDPTPSTEINERKLEHYSRVFLAKMLFDNKKLGLNGEETDRGKTLISYGLSHERKYTMRGGPSGGWVIWQYRMNDGYINLYFHDEFLNGDYHFPISDYRGEESAEILNSLPQMYTYPIEYNQIPIKVEFAQLRGNYDRTKLEFSLAIPFSNTENLSDSAKVFFTFFDFEMNRYLIEFYRLNPDSLNLYERLGESFLLSNFWIELLPRKMESYCAVEIVDQKTRHKATANIPFTIKDFSGRRLKISSIKLTLPSKDKECTNLLNPVPNYRKGETICVSYEIYNLKRGSYGISRYNLTYKIMEPEDKQYRSEFRKTLSYMWSSIAGDDSKRKPYITSSIEQSTNLTYSSDRLQIDTRSLEAGRYLLVLEVEDTISGDNTTEQRDFFINLEEE